MPLNTHTEFPRQCFWWLVLIIFAISVLFPFWIMSVGTFSASKSVSGSQLIGLWPQQVSFQNIQTVLTQIPFLKYAANSLLVSILASVGQILLAALAAYGFTKLKFKFK